MRINCLHILLSLPEILFGEKEVFERGRERGERERRERERGVKEKKKRKEKKSEKKERRENFF